MSITLHNKFNGGRAFLYRVISMGRDFIKNTIPDISNLEKQISVEIGAYWLNK